jgi:predicted ester cyclase
MALAEARLKQPAPTMTGRRLPMGNEQNERLVRRFVDEVFVQRREDAIDELVAPDFRSHTWGPEGMDRVGLREATIRMGQALSDVTFTVEDVIADADRVAVRLTASARQTGEFMGMAPSGRRYTIGEIHIFRIADARVAEHWHQYDQPGLVRQLQSRGAVERHEAGADAPNSTRRRKSLRSLPAGSNRSASAMKSSVRS